MKILIIGADGQLGHSLFKGLNNILKGEVYGTFFEAPSDNLTRLDITNAKEVDGVMSGIRPSLVINTAAMTHVDKCELSPETAQQVNVLGQKNVLEACRKYSAKLIFISTYYVFDGEKGRYKEEDSTNPLNVYAETKLQGEKITMAVPLNLVVRPSKIYSLGYDKKNFLARLVDRLNSNERIEVNNDQYTNPISADDLARCIGELAQINAAGVYHAGGPDYMTNYEFGLKAAGILGFDKNRLLPVSTEGQNAPAKRPMRCALDTEKIDRAIKFRPNSVSENINLWKRDG